MAKKKPEKPTIKAEATAKAEIVAKATYQRKRVITEIIPPDVTRARNSAWLDLISPLTEWAGLTGDKLRKKRELLRIQQDQTLNSIVLDAVKELSDEHARIESIPNKFLVPFLEKASLEDADTELCKTWSTLLMSAATDFNPHMVRFCTILAEIGPQEIRYLSRLCRAARIKRRLHFIVDVPVLFYPVQLIRSINDAIKPRKKAASNLRNIIRENELPGGLLTFICVHRGKSDDQDEEMHELAAQRWPKSVSLLQSLGLIAHEAFIQGESEDVLWYGESISLTSFGVAFVSACDPEIRKIMIKQQLEMEERRAN